ncbi:MAG: rhodanese-like domain-containing protein [Comamonadaceae bacterium]|nr:MAG: rhodanese-like domain-containing protein [Comamonadaceae bacterium]
MKFIEFVTANWMLVLIVLSSGGMLFWPVLRGTGGGGVSAQAAVQLINRERGVVVDLRTPEEFSSGHVVGSRNIPMEQLEDRLAQTVKNKSVPVILLCDSGARAQRAAMVAKKLGFEQAQAMAGGLKAWKAANLPIEKA